MTRTYNFDLPYTVGAFMLTMGWHRLHDDPMFAQLPPALQEKCLAAHNESGASLTLTKEDCDSIPSPVFAHVAEKLGLDYSEA